MRHSVRRMGSATLLLLWMLGCGTAAQAITVPAGFRQIDNAGGIETYQKDYPGGQPDFVVVIDLDRARLDAVTGAVRGDGSGPFGGPNPQFERASLQTFWNREASADSRVHVVANAQFFDPSLAAQARLAFASWSRGSNQSDGYGTHVEFPGQMLLLEIDHTRGAATIRPFDAGQYTRADGPDFRLAGLTTDANKGPNNNVGRTFVGIHDRDGDGRAETVLIFVSLLSSQPHAASMLQAFGAHAQIMLDGGGSSQLITAGISRVAASRTIPHVLVARTRPAPRCDDSCSGDRRCVGDTTFEVCADHNGDGCREWGAAGSCDATARCQGAGSCVTLPPVPDDRDAGSDADTTGDTHDDAPPDAPSDAATPDDADVPAADAFPDAPEAPEAPDTLVSPDAPTPADTTRPRDTAPQDAPPDDAAQADSTAQPPDSTPDAAPTVAPPATQQVNVNAGCGVAPGPLAPWWLLVAVGVVQRRRYLLRYATIRGSAV